MTEANQTSGKRMAYESGGPRISRAELERRWALLRRRMDERNVDAVIASSSDHMLHGGSAKWLTGGAFGYTLTVVFHRNDLMTRIEHGAEGEVRKFTGDESAYRGVGVARKSAEFCAVGYSHDKHVAQVVQDLAPRNYRRIALLGPGRMSHALVAALQDGLPNVEFVDETEFIDRQIATKSPEEIDLIMENVAIQADAFNAVLAKTKPGMREIEVLNLVKSEVFSRGGTGGVIEMGAAPLGRPAFIVSPDRQRILEKGDQISMLIETTGPDGYFAHMGRTFVLGRASSELHDAAALMADASDRVRSGVRIGAAFSDVIDEHNTFMASHGHPPEMRALAHGQGYDAVQRPLIRSDETLLAAEGMFVGIHPSFVTSSVFAWMCDNFLVGADGASEPLHQVEQRVFEI